MNAIVVWSFSVLTLQAAQEEPPQAKPVHPSIEAIQKRMISDVYITHARDTAACYESHDCMFDGLCHWDWRVSRCIATKSSCLGSFGCLTHGACHVDAMSGGDGCHVLSQEDCTSAAFCSKDFLGPTGHCEFDPKDGVCVAMIYGTHCFLERPCWALSRTKSRCKLLEGRKRCAMWPTMLDAAHLLPSRTTLWPGPME